MRKEKKGALFSNPNSIFKIFSITLWFSNWSRKILNLLNNYCRILNSLKIHKWCRWWCKCFSNNKHNKDNLDRDSLVKIKDQINNSREGNSTHKGNNSSTNLLPNRRNSLNLNKVIPPSLLKNFLNGKRLKKRLIKTIRRKILMRQSDYIKNVST